MGWGRSVEAADLYRELLKAYPDSARTWVNLGNAQAAAGRRSEAQAAYRAALRIAPGDQDALNYLAWLLLQEGDRLDEAETLAMRAVAEPQLEGAQSLETLGRIQLARKRYRDAVAAFEGALSLAEAPSAGLRAFLLEGLGQAYRTCGDAEAARAAFRAALLADPSSSAAENARSALQALENRP